MKTKPIESLQDELQAIAIMTAAGSARLKTKPMIANILVHQAARDMAIVGMALATTKPPVVDVEAEVVHRRD